MGDNNKGIHRDSIKTQLARLGMDDFFSDEKTPRGQKVIDKNPIKDRAEKNVKSRKVFKKVTQRKPVPQKQKSASPKGTKFFDFFTS